MIIPVSDVVVLVGQGKSDHIGIMPCDGFQKSLVGFNDGKRLWREVPTGAARNVLRNLGIHVYTEVNTDTGAEREVAAEKDDCKECNGGAVWTKCCICEDEVLSDVEDGQPVEEICDECRDMVELDNYVEQYKRMAC